MLEITEKSSLNREPDLLVATNDSKPHQLVSNSMVLFPVPYSCATLKDKAFRISLTCNKNQNAIN